MVVAERKPLNEILAMLQAYKRILVAGCKGCVTVCTTGGKKEVEILASEIRISRKKEGQEADVKEITLERQCDPEYINQLEDLIKDRDAVLSIACTVGPQYIAGRYMDKMVFPGLNTTFIGGSVEHGVFAEFCQACGNCVIHNFGGLCPITRCSKSLFNGPCGGSANGKCEISKEVDCVWQLIYDRLKGLGQLDRLNQVVACKDWTTSRDGGPRKMIREELKL
jgi:Methylene-tetrahydrofolate reductase C terminal